MSSWLSSIAESIGNIANNIVQGITEILEIIFVPQKDFLTEKYEYIKTKFNFLWDIIDIINNLLIEFNMLEQKEPPYVEISLVTNNSKYNWGNSALILDLSFYAPYKSTVDIFLKSILWIFFFWRLFIHLPNIISGISGSIDYMGKITKKGR